VLCVRGHVGSPRTLKRMVLENVQRALGEAVRSKVAGPDADTRAGQIWGKPGPRWFGPEDPVWRVHEDASMFPGGIAALLLQTLHPLAMAGVAGHSGYRSDPWGRLTRTGDYIATTTYATIPDAEALIQRVRARHDQVRGKDYRGRPYRASDPELLAWVHAAEVQAFLWAYQAYGRAPLSPREADLYVEQAGLPAAKLGVPDPPCSVAELTAVIEGMRPRLEASPEALDTVDFLLRTPPVTGPAQYGYRLLAYGAVAVLPYWVRSMLGIALPEAGMPLASGLGRFGTAAVRWGLAGVQNRRSASPAARAKEAGREGDHRDHDAQGDRDTEAGQGTDL
jgi:uncharacterized protein (DUF2236 family)